MKNKHFLLDPKIIFMNHGSFGACPKPIFDDYQKWQRRLEKQPVLFSTETIYDLFRKSRIALGEFVGCHEDDIVLFQNPTVAVSNVMYSLKLQPHDQVLMSNHEYGALVRAWSIWARSFNVDIVQRNVELPLCSEEEFVDNIWSGVTPKTKVIFLSHITSATALEFPVKKICELAKAAGIITIIDGAHVPGQINLNIKSLGCDFYTGACHKWLCAPKGTSFLYVKDKHQSWMRPLIYSWGKDGDDPGPTEFLQNFQWQGTRDMASFYTLPTVIDYYHKYIKDSRKNCRKLIQLVASQLTSILGTAPIFSSKKWINQMVSHRLPKEAPADLKTNLLKKFNIEVPIFHWHGERYIRVSCNIYNNKTQIDYFLKTLRTLI